ncbi:hypothetical protein GGE06_001301 [Streptomyces sp. SFB5A]|uniref:PPM-type phosphatase domain-containing protein n=1 Tax=Streptomyces nymphaeiformis TaxID=2663842 RepID=A0A7W7TW42_9ACTN|nr:hypothetical protein [Streptomyces nymphaeiformis]
MLRLPDDTVTYLDQASDPPLGARPEHSAADPDQLADTLLTRLIPAADLTDDTALIVIRL